MKPLGREGPYPGVAGERPTACTHPGAAAGARGSEALGAQTASGSAPDCLPACRVPRTNTAADSARRRWVSNNRFLRHVEAPSPVPEPRPLLQPPPATSSAAPPLHLPALSLRPAPPGAPPNPATRPPAVLPMGWSRGGTHVRRCACPADHVTFGGGPALSPPRNEKRRAAGTVLCAGADRGSRWVTQSCAAGQAYDGSVCRIT